MKKHYYKYSVAELDDEPRVVRESLAPEFLAELLADTDAAPVMDEPGSLDVTLIKTGEEVLVQGQVRVRIAVPCAQTLDPAIYDLAPEVLLLLKPSKDTVVAQQKPRRQRSVDLKQEKKQKNKGNWQNDPLLADEDAAEDCYFGDELILDSFLREFILLELPMVPLREDLRDGPMEATRPLPEDQMVNGTGEKGEESSSDEGEKPIDPRLSPLAEIKARLENKE